MKTTDLERQVDALVEKYLPNIYAYNPARTQNEIKMAVLEGVDLGFKRAQDIINTAREREIELNYQEQKERLSSLNASRIQ